MMVYVPILILAALRVSGNRLRGPTMRIKQYPGVILLVDALLASEGAHMPIRAFMERARERKPHVFLRGTMKLPWFLPLTHP
jgi:hypothetical protein